MGREQRRSERVEITLPVQIVVRDEAGESALAQTIGRISDISRYGLRLSVLHAKIADWHIFYSFHENDAAGLVLEVRRDARDGGEAPDFRLPVRPVWFDRMLSQPDKPFLLGMEFLQEPDRRVLDWLNSRISSLEAGQKTGWLSRLFGA